MDKLMTGAQKITHAVCFSPFREVACEVLAKADDTPILCIIGPIESILMGQVHLWIHEEQILLEYHTP